MGGWATWLNACEHWERASKRKFKIHLVIITFSNNIFPMPSSLSGWSQQSTFILLLLHDFSYWCHTKTLNMQRTDLLREALKKITERNTNGTDSHLKFSSGTQTLLCPVLVVQMDCGWLVYVPSLYTCTFKQLNCTNPDLSNLDNQWLTYFLNRVYNYTAVQLHCCQVSVHLHC